MLPPDLEHVIEQDHRALDAFVRGDPEPKKRLFSRGDDATLANPLGPPARGWTAVEQRLEHAASQFRDGEPHRFERVSQYAFGDLAYILEIERSRMRIAGSSRISPTALRVTTIFRREEGEWKIVHRHADPITSPRDAETVAET